MQIKWQKILQFTLIYVFDIVNWITVCSINLKYFVQWITIGTMNSIPIITSLVTNCCGLSDEPVNCLWKTLKKFFMSHYSPTSVMLISLKCQNLSTLLHRTMPPSYWFIISLTRYLLIISTIITSQIPSSNRYLVRSPTFRGFPLRINWNMVINFREINSNIVHHIIPRDLKNLSNKCNIAW